VSYYGVGVSVSPSQRGSLTHICKPHLRKCLSLCGTRGGTLCVPIHTYVLF